MSNLKQDIPIYVIESNKRCKLRGLDCKVVPQPNIICEEELNQKLRQFTKIFKVVNFFIDKFFQMVQGYPILLVITDGEGTVLETKGDVAIKSIVEKLGFRQGLKFTEEQNGTNSISLALELNQPVQIVGTQHYQDFLKGTACYTIPFEFDNKIGTISIMTLVDYQSPLLLSMLASIVSAIERELLLKEKNKELNILNQIVTQSTRNGIIQLDQCGNIKDFNCCAENLIGWKKEEVIGKKIGNNHPLEKFLQQILQTEHNFSDIEMVIVNEKTHKKAICLVEGMPLYDRKGALTGAFGQLKDITERYEAKARINYLAYHDDLTGLLNRRYFQTALDEQLKKEEEQKGMFATCLLDLDRFKTINDTLGHEKGDILLCEVSKRLTAYLPENATICRMGGDEFTIILSNVPDQNYVHSIAKGIIELFQKPFKIEHYEFHVSTSIGISIYPYDGQKLDILFSKADTAMYRAKEQGKNNYSIYNLNMEQRIVDKLKFEVELRNAIEKDEFVLYYQPQIDLENQNIVGAEALIRWNHPTLGLLFPGDFIPLAEEMGMADELGEWVLENACHQLKYWQDCRLPEIKVAVNISTQDFLKNGLVERVKQVLENTKLEPSLIELEITESMTMDVNHAITVLESLNELGVQIAIDDFGKGYSSLNYLKNFPLNHLKIDRLFVSDILKDQNDVKIISAIVSLAHGLNLDVIAEGVETKEQAVFLSNLNCDQVQGFYYSKPVPPDEFEEILRLGYMKH